MSTWLQSRFRAAEGFLEAVDEVATQYVSRNKHEEPATSPPPESPAIDETEPPTDVENHVESVIREINEKKKTPLVPKPTREARLLSVCEQLRQKLKAAQDDAGSLKPRLAEAERRRDDHAREIEKLVEDANRREEEKHTLEATLHAQVVAKEMELAKEQLECQKWRAEALKLQHKCGSLEANLQKEADERATHVTQITQDLREEIEKLETALHQEKTGHAASMGQVLEREERLQEELSSSAALLSALQRQLTSKSESITRMEDQIQLLEKNQKDESNASLHLDQIRELEFQLETSRRDLQLQIKKSEELEGQLKTSGEKLAAIQSDVNSALHPEPLTLQSQLDEVRELLCQKQLELEGATSYAASLQVFHGRQIQQLQDRIQSLTTPNDTVVSLDSHSHNNSQINQSLAGALKWVDRWVAHVMHLCRRSFLWRTVIFVYALFLHLYLYYLSSRIQSVATETHSAGFVP